MRRLLSGLLALAISALAVAPLGAQESAPEYYFLQDPADVDATGRLRPPGDRIPVVFVHGFLKDDLVLERKIHIVFSFLHGRFVKKVNRGEDPFEHVFPIHYRYSPNKHYRELGEDFARRFTERFGEIPCILVVHSAGAMIGRWAAESGLLVLAMVGLAPAHGGSPGASLMYANRKLLADGRVEEPHMDVVEQTLEQIGVPDPAARSLAWDNADGAITEAEAAKYGIEIQPPLPPFRFDRFDHYGVLDHFVAPFAGFDFMGNTKQRKKSDRELEWEVLGQFSEKWKRSDGVVVPYPETEADGETKIWKRTYKGIGHREIFFDKDVLETAWSQVQATAAHLLADGPSPFEDAGGTLVADAGDLGEDAPGDEPGEPEEGADDATGEGDPEGDGGGTQVATRPDEGGDTPVSDGGLDDLDDLDLGDVDDLDLDLPDETEDGGEDLADAGEDPVDEPVAGPVGDAPVAVAAGPVPETPRGVDLRRVEETGILPGPPRRRARGPGGALFDSWDPGRMTRWVDG